MGGLHERSQPPLDGPEDLNCTVFGMVDFGHGPVEVRCTKKGPHDDHTTEVHIYEGEPEITVSHVFDG